MEIPLARDRWDKITGLIEMNGKTTVDEIVRVLDVSSATVRRDLRRMHRLGMISRTRGGAVSPSQASFDPAFSESQHMSTQEKEMIGLCAARLVGRGDTVIIDGGATTYQVAINIVASDVVVVTNAYSVVNALMPKQNVEVIVIGGLLSRHSAVAVGPDAVRMVSQLKADKAIIGVNGISVEGGITIPNRLVAEVKRVIVDHSAELIVVADHTKLGVSSLFSIAPIEAVDKLITDVGATETQIDGFQKAGVEVIVAGRCGVES